MWGLGYSPAVMLTLGVVPSTAAQFFTNSEQAYMEVLFDLTTEDKIQRKVDGVVDSLQELRLADGVNRKLGLHSANKLRDILDDVVFDLDAEFPDSAPHAALYGPKFPRDIREIPIEGKILTVNGGKLQDAQGLFGDPYWESVAPDERLQNHELQIASGPAKGEVRQILNHVIFGAGAPYVEVDDATDISTGTRFVVREATIPQDNLGKKDRARDWVVTTAIRGVFTSAAAGQIFAVVFGDTYWNDAKKTLKERTLIVLDGAFPGEYLILVHDIGGGFIEVEGAPAFAGDEQYAIKAVSPLENGVQIRGSLRRGDPGTDARYDTLEPGSKRRVHSKNVFRLASAQATAVNDEVERINRYLHMRFHEWFGSYFRLRRYRKTALRILQQTEQERLMHGDIETAVTDLNLFVNIDEPDFESG